MDSQVAGAVVGSLFVDSVGRVWRLVDRTDDRVALECLDAPVWPSVVRAAVSDPLFVGFRRLEVVPAEAEGYAPGREKRLRARVVELEAQLEAQVKEPDERVVVEVEDRNAAIRRIWPRRLILPEEFRVLELEDRVKELEAQVEKRDWLLRPFREVAVKVVSRPSDLEWAAPWLPRQAFERLVESEGLS